MHFFLAHLSGLLSSAPVESMVWPDRYDAQGHQEMDYFNNGVGLRTPNEQTTAPAKPFLVQ
jgi:hypothetical protein